MKIIFTAFLFIALLFSCVPARKYQELKKSQDNCQTNLNDEKAKKQGFIEKNEELTDLNQRLVTKNRRIMEDNKSLDKSLKALTINYDKINETYGLLLEQNKELLLGNKLANKKLMKNFQQSQEELQAKEDRLRELETTLNNKQKTLDDLSTSLEEREMKVLELESIIRRKDSLSNALKDRVKQALLNFENKGLSIHQKNGKVYVSLDEKLLFASGRYDVGASGVTVLKELSKVLAKTNDINVVVEGHTDDVAFKGSNGISDNWDLSTKRATSVVKILLQNKTLLPKNVTAAGKGEHYPLVPNTDKEARKKNRRIEIILTPNLDELFKILE